MIDTLPLWQIAMVLQATQAQRLGLRGEYGIDYQLLNWPGREACRSLNWKVRTARLRSPASRRRLMLLDDTLTHWHTNAPAADHDWLVAGCAACKRKAGAYRRRSANRCMMC
jgi:uncharacterized protein YbaP (TraB family)